MKQPAPGFTLIEMMAVVVIIGILAAVIAPHLFQQVNVTEQTAALQDIRKIEQAISLYRYDSGNFPVSLSDLVHPPDENDRWRGPYLRAEPRDPWGKPYQYREPGQDAREFDVWSYGRDGAEGGDDLDADITGWIDDGDEP